MYKHRMLRILMTALLCWIWAFSAALPTFGEELPETELFLESEAAVLMDAETGQILFEKNADKQMYPASITKIMTGYLALKQLDPQDILTVSWEAYYAVPRDSSHVSLEPGEQLTVEQLLYALALKSANDAANVLAEGVSGSLTDFAELMTQTARELGACNTHFANASGLPNEEHYTTAYDMALITAAALNMPGFTDYFSAVNYECAGTNLCGPRSFTNENRILAGGEYFYEGVQMAKTGWTSSAQGTLVTAVKRGDTTLIAVLLKSPRTEHKYQDAWALLNYGFSGFQPVNVTGEDIAEQLSIENYGARKGQQFSFLLPFGKTAKDITFSQAEFTPEKTVTLNVSAEIGGMALPAFELIAEHLPETEDIEQPEPEETGFREALAEAPRMPVMVAAVSGVLLIGVGAEYCWRSVAQRKKQTHNQSQEDKV